LSAKLSGAGRVDRGAGECYPATVSVLEVTDLGFGYTAEPLFRDATFRVNAGERVSLVAPNGAGKTTLLRLVAGELAADQGTVVVGKGTSIGFLRQSHELDRLMDGT